MIDTADTDFDTDDDDDDFTDSDSIDENLDKESLKSKRDIRAEIEKKLELIALRKKMSDFYDDEIFN
jgi:hypothetical protein